MEQFFYTKVAPQTTLALYQLSIRQPGGVLSPLPEYNFTFPLTPSSVTKEPSALTALYDVSGPATTQGVTRLVDEFGISPPNFTIVGTTGWKYHSADGFTWTGREACTRLQNLIDNYAQLNQTSITNQANQPYTLEFYDFSNEEFWVVSPIGPVSISQDQQRPLVRNYTLRLAAVKAVSAPYLALARDFVLDNLAIAESGSASMASAAMGEALLTATTLTIADSSAVISAATSAFSSITSSLGL